MPGLRNALQPGSRWMTARSQNMSCQRPKRPETVRLNTALVAFF
jgi:hypothetical protein